MAEEYTYGILSCFLKWEREIPDAIFLRQPVGNNWKEYTWQEVGIEARKIAAQFQQMEIKRGAKITIWSANCADWIIFDLAIMMGGYVSVPIYANINTETFHGILVHSDCSLLLVGKLERKYWESNKNAIPSSAKVMAMPGHQYDSVMSWNDIAPVSPMSTEINYPSIDDLLTIIYTSGTTGMPKGVMHTYKTTIHAVLAAAEMAQLNQRGNRFISYLPLSHAAERGIVEFGAIYCGGSISFVESIERFSRTIREVKPTHFLGVPRIWQKFREGILEKVSQRRIEQLLKIPGMANIFKRRIRTSLSLQKARVMISGAAPITVDLLNWFHRLGLHIQEGYGLTEDFNVCTMNPREAIRIGSAGKPFEGQEIKFLPGTHEILQRSDWIMTGYYKDPEQTAKALQNGYFYTGDMGEMVDGYLFITGRVKDIFKTTKGEYISPLPIESYFLAMDEIDQACVVGSNYPQPFMVVVLSKYGKALNKAQLESRVNLALETYNQKVMEFQKLKKIIIVQEDWTPENNYLTLTLKLKRNVVSKHYEDKLGAVYNTDDKVSWECNE